MTNKYEIHGCDSESDIENGIPTFCGMVIQPTDGDEWTSCLERVTCIQCLKKMALRLMEKIAQAKNQAPALPDGITPWTLEARYGILMSGDKSVSNTA